MPVPTPSGDESEDEFVSRCMGDDAMQEYPDDQRAAICYGAFSDRSITPEGKMRTTTRQPEPMEGETSEDFIDRCMAFPGLADMDADQRAAVCWDAYRQSVAPPETSFRTPRQKEGKMNLRTQKLHELRRARAAKAAEIDAWLKAEDNRPLDQPATPEQLASLEALQGQLAEIDGRIGRLEAAMTADAEKADENGENGNGDDDENEDKRFRPIARSPHAAVMGSGGLRIPGRFEARPGRDDKGFGFARYLIGLAWIKWYGEDKAVEQHWNRFKDAKVIRALQSKALNIGVVSQGGALIPQDFMLDLIELLRAATVIRGAGPTIVGMPLGNLTLPRLAGGSTAAYQGEMDDISLTEPAFDDLNLFAKKLTALVPASNDLLRRAPLSVEAIIRDDLVQSVARREDLAFIRGDGAGLSPVGLRSLVLPANLIAVPAGGTLDTVVATISAMKMALVQGMSRMIRPVWISSAPVFEFIATRRDDVGGFYFRDEIMQGRLDGFPFYYTQQIPTNLAPGTGTELYLVDMADVIIGDTMDVQVDASDVAAYYGTDGGVVSAFQRDQSLFRVITAHDFNMRHLQSLAIAILPDWASFNGLLPPAPGRPWSGPPVLNQTWAFSPAAWPANPDHNPCPVIFDPAVVATNAFEGQLTRNPGGGPYPLPDGHPTGAPGVVAPGGNTMPPGAPEPEPEPPGTTLSGGLRNTGTITPPPRGGRGGGGTPPGTTTPPGGDDTSRGGGGGAR